MHVGPAGKTGWFDVVMTSKKTSETSWILVDYGSFLDVIFRRDSDVFIRRNCDVFIRRDSDVKAL